jgi:hypothetical protein
MMMKMTLRSVVLILTIALVSACGSRTGNEMENVRVKEVIQVETYTYLLVEASGKKGEFWIAAPSTEASPGDNFSYKGGMEMTDFYSNELGRSFERVLFVDVLYTQGDVALETTPGSRTKARKVTVEVGHDEGILSISDIYANPAAYEGKVIRVTGEVTRFNPAIMERNWLHLQDGTDHEGKFDLTVTTSETFKVGTVVTLQGVLALDRDFGYGYSYEVLLEKATRVE